MNKKKALAVQSNNLIESRYILTTSEQKLCLAMISKIKPDGFMVKGGRLTNMSTVDYLPAKIHLQMKSYEQEKSVSCAVK